MIIDIPILGFGHTGGYRVLSELANQWIIMGHSVRFLVSTGSPMPYFHTRAEILWLDEAGKAAKTGGENTYGKQLGRKGVLRMLRTIWNGLNRFSRNSDIILANHSLTSWPVSLCNSHALKFYYVQAFEPEYYSVRPGINNRVLQMLATGSYLLPLQQIANASVYLNHKVIRAKQYVPPGIDFMLMHPKAMIGTLTQPVILGCIGRHEPQKGTRFVLEAFRRLQVQGASVELHVAYGNLPPGAEHISNLKVVIPKNDTELASYYRSLDIMIAPGTVQLGAPHYPVMEAMACGIPVITTGYLPADPTNAWIVPIEESQPIVEAVFDILQNPNLCLKKTLKAQNDIKPFGWPTVAKRMITVFEDSRYSEQNKLNNELNSNR